MKIDASVWKNEIPKNARNLDQGYIICCDALDLLDELNEECADIIFLDPPFNLGKKYGSSKKAADQVSDALYEDFIKKVLELSIKVLKKGGALYLYHLPQWAIKFGGFLQKRMLFRHWIAISMKNGFVRGNYLYPAHYALLYFTKDNPNNFNRPKIPVKKCRKCGEYIKDYGGYKRYVEDGINLSDVWEDLSPVRHSIHKKRSENELPLELIRRIVQISGVSGGLLVDPFVGSGTSIISAIEADMGFIASDRESIFCEIATSRIEDYRRINKSK